MDNPSLSDVTGGRQAEIGISGLPFFTNAGFALVACAFLLPFFEFRCNGTGMAQVNGADLITGDEPTILSSGRAPTSNLELAAQAAQLLDQEFNAGQGTERVRQELQERGMLLPTAAGVDQQQDLVRPNIWAITLLASALLGLLVHLLFRARAAPFALALAVIGTASLILMAAGLRAQFNALVPPDLGLPADARLSYATAIGFWAACAGCVIALISALMRMRPDPASRSTA